MARIYHVKKARKDQGRSDYSGEPIPAGSAYKWWKPRYGGKRKRLATEPNWRPSEMTSSDKLALLYGAQENVEDAVEEFQKSVTLVDADDDSATREAALEESNAALDTLREAMREASEQATEAADGYNESADAQEEYFSGSSQIDEIREKAEAAQSFAEALETAADDLEEIDTDDPDVDVEDWAWEQADKCESAAGELNL